MRFVSATVAVSPQITAEALPALARDGFTLVINNRPDGEEAGQPDGASIAAAVADAGLAYVAIPVDHRGFSQDQVSAMAAALAQADGRVLAFCRSGTRSCLLWALAQAAEGGDPAALGAAAAGAGYDLTPIAPALRALHQQR